MKGMGKFPIVVSAVGLVLAGTGRAQDAATTQSSASPNATPAVAEQPATETTVPRLIKFTGAVVDSAGKAGSGRLDLVFSLYEMQEGGSPLWTERQTAQLDGQGRYTVILGANSPDGLPLELFTSGKALWLGVQPELAGVGEQPHVLLVAVPYALKAADADTLGGKPASSFVTTEVPPSSAQAASSGSSVASAATSATPKQSVRGSEPSQASTASIGGSGTTHFIPIWMNSTTLGNSILFQTGGKVGIGTTSPSAKLETVAASEGTLAFRLRSGPNSFLDITPTNTGGRFQTVLNTVNNRDVVLLTGTGTSFRVGASTTTPAAKAEVVVPGEGTLAFRLLSGPNSFLDITPTNTGGRFQTVLNTVNNRDVILLTGTGRVGVGTSTPSNVFTIAAGSGHAISDGWDTYSSRRWKTNIHTLQGALRKVEQLRGVSYDQRFGGKHEIGVIAEDVGQVVPEVVTYEDNGKDARGVDYSRLTALLIEAIKEQQKQIKAQQARTQELSRSNSHKDEQIRKLTEQVQQLQSVQGTMAVLEARLDRVESGQRSVGTTGAQAQAQNRGARPKVVKVQF